MTETTKKAKSKCGRPRVEIDWAQFDKLCQMQCTLREIASFFDCSEDTIENAVKRDHKVRFSEYYEQKRGVGKISLRRKQFEVALSGNVTMLIWLGKQYLGQADEPKEDNKFGEEKKFVVRFFDGATEDP